MFINKFLRNDGSLQERNCLCGEYLTQLDEVVTINKTKTKNFFTYKLKYILFYASQNTVNTVLFKLFVKVKEQNNPRKVHLESAK